jgi:hypothetical protein
VARGYALGGGRKLLDAAMEIRTQGNNRDYFTLPRAADDEVRSYAWIDGSTKGDWVSPTTFMLGQAAHPRADEEPPAAVSDLKAAALDGRKVELTWTAPGDAGRKAARYQVKYAGQPLADYPYTGEQWREQWRTVTYWNMAANVAGEPEPAQPGKKERMVVTVPAGTNFYFAVRSYDGGPNLSALGNVAAVEVR